jgi:putative aminopeptidase FrvX
MEREGAATSRVVKPEHLRWTISSRALARSPEPDEVLAVLRRIAAAPTAPYHEWAVLDAIRDELERGGLATRTDAFGQVHARVSAGAAKRALAFAAHTDHPAFEVIEASGRTGNARVLGGFRQRAFPSDVAVTVHDDVGGASFAAVLSEPATDVEPLHNSTTVCRIRAEGPLAVGQFAVLDLPSADVAGDEIRMGAADDLAGCALIVCALLALRDEREPHDVHAVFTRAEETGLYGARLVAEDGLVPRDAYVVSVEASRALPGAEAGRGIVVRAGDLYNTFSNEAERYLRVARERLEERGIPVQRALLVGGTCEASSFVRLGWTATGMALPNINYHNAAPDGGFAPEIVRLSDLMSGIALAVEAALAAGVDADESWWPDVRLTPAVIRDLLKQPRSKKR